MADGRNRRYRGLLNTGRRGGGLLAGPVMADQYDEEMFARAPNGYEQTGPQMFRALRPEPAAPPPEPARREPERREERPRVSGWRVFDRVLGGQTVSEALDTERERIASQAASEQRRNLLGKLTEGLSPQERLAFELNPEAYGDALAARFAPETLAEGSVQVINGRPVAGAPVVDRFEDRFGVFDPITQQSRYTDPRGPTFGEQTDRLAAATENLAPGNRLVDATTGGVIAAAPDAATLSPGQVRFEGNRPVASVAPAPTGDPVQARRAVEAIERQVGATLGAVERAKEQVGFWTTGPLAGLSVIGGTPAADLAATIDTIEANLSFQALAEMRANSPTGGALGQVTERELALLGATVASLRQSQSPEQLRENLAIIERSLTNLAQAQRQALTENQGAAQPQFTPEEIAAELRRRGLR